MSLKKELLKAFGAVKRTLKEYKSYVVEKAFAEKYLPTHIISAYSMGA